MKLLAPLSFTFPLLFILVCTNVYSQCPDCGNGVADPGETNLTCPQDVAHGATCISPCGQPGSFETATGIRQSEDFVGTTTWSTSGLPLNWSFASGPTATSSGTLIAAGTDTYGAKAGLIQPNCSGSCTSTNGFCIGNLANLVSVGSGGANGKLGANFDGRANISQDLSYAVLRGQGNPTLVSPTYNMSGVEGFKVQFWLFPSEASCGQTNSWGTCTGNSCYLDFSSDGGTSWAQVLTMNLSSSNTDMCINNSTNTKWLTESSWSRVCLTVYKSATSPGNFYTAASSTTAASGVMVSSSYFTANFKYRIRYVQSASCTSGITATNPGRYLAIDYPVITSGNEMIPCGISFANMCGYGADNNDDGVGGTGTSTNTVFSTVKRGINQAERGVEIFTSQTSTYTSQNLSGSSLSTNYDLCNAEGGDRQCINWLLNNNFYTVVYECIADWEAPSGTGIEVKYYKGTTPQSVGMTKVTTAGKTALIGWRYSANRFVSCGSTSDINPGCNGYSFLSGSLPTQSARGFYGLAVNSTGQSWPFYGATSCSHYFNGPFFAPISKPDTLTGSGNYLLCVSGSMVFTGLVNYCSSSAGFTGSATINVTGPGGFSDSFNSGSNGSVPVTTPGEYIITANTPATPNQCIDCSQSVCVTISAADLAICSPLPIELISFTAERNNRDVILKWTTASETNNQEFIIERSSTGIEYSPIAEVTGSGSSNEVLHYSYMDKSAGPEALYYRLKQVDFDGQFTYSQAVHVSGYLNASLYPNPNDGNFFIDIINGGADVIIRNTLGEKVFEQKNLPTGKYPVELLNIRPGIYFVEVIDHSRSVIQKITITR